MPSLRVDRPRSACGRHRRRPSGRPRAAAHARCARSTRSTRRLARICLIVSTSSSTSPSVSPPAISSSSNKVGCVASALASSRRLRSSSVSDPATMLALSSMPACSSAATAASSFDTDSRPLRTERAADEHVLEHRQPFERARDLRSATDAAMAPSVCRQLGDVLTRQEDACRCRAADRRRSG